MDICLTINRRPGGSTSRPGGVLDVSLLGVPITECIHPRLAVVVVENVPDNGPPAAQLRRLKDLERSIEDYSDLSNPRLIRQNRWRVLISALPSAARSQLQDTGVCYVDWVDAKPAIQRRVVAQESDESRDTHTAIENDDL